MKFYEHRMEKIKAVFNWSGGKDSAHALWRARQSELYDIVALLTTINRDSQRSSMHGIPLPLLQAQADSIGIPLHIVNLTPQGNLENYGKVIITRDNFSAMIVFIFFCRFEFYKCYFGFSGGHRITSSCPYCFSFAASPAAVAVRCPSGRSVPSATAPSGSW